MRGIQVVGTILETLASDKQPRTAMKLIFTLLALLLVLTICQAQDLILRDVYPGTVEIKAFALNNDTRVNVIGTGGVFMEDYRILVYYGWILDTETRKVVWHLFDELKDQDFKREDGFYDFNVDVDLPAGNYELYFTGGYDNRSWNDGEWTMITFDEVMNEIFNSRDKEKFRRSIQEDLYVEVKAPAAKTIQPDDLLREQTKGAILYFVKARDNEKFEQGFTLNGDTKLRIYSIGEGGKDETFDYLWIYDAATHKRVFEMNYRNTSFAGGAKKNLMVHEEIELPAGSYLASYSTDGSHSYEKWNALPPDDPLFWGVMLTPSSARDRQNVLPYNPPKTVTPVVEMVRIRDDELVSTGFSLNKDTDVRILCLGEEDYDDGMADYGWIVDANTRETVWMMKRYRTEYAGGADKNRRVDEVLPLPKGDYLAYYTTDGSHSYNDWNASRPHEEDRWGLTLWATREGDLSNFSTFNPEEYKAKNVIAEIVMVEDDEYYKESFTLSQSTKVTIIGMGEGDSGDMYDYGWIKNMDTGKIEWEMDYYDTDHAGGARKNRIVTESLTLPAGEYRIYYETDGSHSFRRWNADPPRDPQGYGIRVLKAE